VKTGTDEGKYVSASASQEIKNKASVHTGLIVEISGCREEGEMGRRIEVQSSN
jgi:hypothetical protein